MNSSASQSELSLAAFRYLAGELDAADTDAFERLLANDEAAQQALVHAVQISTALQSETLVSQVVPSSRAAQSHRPQRVSRWSSALALVGSALVAATVLVALRDESTSQVAFVSSENSSVDATVSLWSELDVEGSDTSGMDESMLVMLDGEASEGVQVPDWMLAAVDTDVASAGDRPSDPPAIPAGETADDES